MHLLDAAEEKRLAALARLDILDSAPEELYDDLATLAAELCEAPIATVSLIDRDRQWFKARHGLDSCETSRDVSFCAVAIRRPDEMLIVPDTRLDPQFQGNALVTGPPFLRFYAGVPLVTSDGFALGTLCVLDYKPRRLEKAQYDRLKLLAKQVTALLELRKLSQDQRQLSQAQARLIDELRTAQSLLDTLLERERRITQELQESFLPDLRSFKHPQLEIAAIYQAALDESLVGGDFYDAFLLPDGRLALVLGDVVGKGLAAAAFTAEIRFSLRVMLRHAADPAAALSELDDLMAGDNAYGEPWLRYTSVIAAILEPSTGNVKLAMAASEDALVLREDGTSERFLLPGPPVGFITPRQFALGQFTLKPGDTLILLTDGFTEARCGADFLQYEGVQRLAESALCKPLDQIASTILEGARAFASGRMHDDACLLLVRLR